MTIPVTLNDKVNKIRTSIYGRDVREALASGIEEVSATADSVQSRQDALEAKYDEQVKNSSGINEVKDAHVAVNGKTYDTIGKRIDNIERLNTVEFDFTSIEPVLHTVIHPARASVLQGLVFDEDTGEIYVTQVAGVTPPGATDSFAVSRMNKYGALLDSMVVTFGGHATVFGIEKEGGSVYIWINCDITSEGGVAEDYKLVRILYQPGVTIDQTSPTMVTYPKFSDMYTSVTTDPKNDLIVFRYTPDNGPQTMDLRKLSEVKNNIDNVLGTIVIPDDLNDDTMQGMTIDGYDLYFRTGDNAGVYPDKITQFKFDDDTFRRERTNTFGQGINGAYADAYREPEGLFIYTDPKTSKKTLFASVVTGDQGRRILKIYAFHQPGNGEKFQGEIMEYVQRYELTANNGNAKQIPSNTTLLASIIQPGSYYFKTDDSALMTDHPEPGTAGWWLDVEPPNSDGAVQQTIKRNTSTGNYVTYVRKVNADLTYDNWTRVGGKFGMTVPVGTTKLSDIVTPGNYYLSTSETAIMTDHPEPGTAGWWFEVSLQNTSGQVVQTLKRNTSSNLYNVYTRVVQDSTVGAWDRFAMELLTKPMPSGATAIKDVKTAGKYYMSTSDANSYSDSPQKNTTSGWFLEVSAKNPDGDYFQIMRNNVTTTSSLKTYYRQIDGATGNVSGWKNLTAEKVTLWSGSCKADFTTWYSLAEPLSNFDMVYFLVTSDTGNNATDRMVLMQTWTSNDLQFEFNNLSDTSGTLGYWLFEYCVTFDATLSTFKNKRAVRLKVDASNVQTRTDSDGTMGLVSIVGIRL
jgi:hypothetical protein